MKIPPLYRSLQTQRGVSLIELMIAMVIGLIVLMALGYFFLGSRQINRTTDDVSRMQESGRNALELIGKAVRQAGYRRDANVAFAGISLAGVDGASGAPDTITVEYEAQEGGEINCIGTTVGAGVTTAIVTYAFVVNSVSNPPTLNCNGTVVVDNIEDMQIDYGIDAEKDGVIELYKTNPTAAEFGQVASVHVTLLVRGPSLNISTDKTQTYTFNGSSITSTDGYLRQVYSATFTVRNQAG